MPAPSEDLKAQAESALRRQKYEAALDLYRELLRWYGETEAIDSGLRNRIGDLYQQLGHPSEAISLYLRCADEYAQQGALSEAVALCHKILRHAPRQIDALRRLARFSAEKGLGADAEQFYLMVAYLLEARGEHAESLRVLSEFSNRFADDAHVRSAVIEYLIRAGREHDALFHITVLHRIHAAAGDSEQAEGVARLARHVDATWEPDPSDDFGSESPAGGPLVLLRDDEDFVLLERTETADLSALVPVEGLAVSLRTALVEFAAERRSGRDRRRSDRRKIGRRYDTREYPGLPPIDGQ